MDIKPGSQINMFDDLNLEQELTKSSYIRDMHPEHKDTSNIIPPVNYGLQKNYLKLIESDALKHIFYGMNNLDIPKEMLAVLNPDEILSMYLATGCIKQDKEKHRHYSNALSGDNLYDMINAFNIQTYRIDGEKGKKGFNLCKIKNKVPLYKRNQCGLETRLKNLPSEIRDSFVQSFRKKYEEPQHIAKMKGFEGNFIDVAYEPPPTIVSRKSKKLRYIDGIFKQFKAMYANNT